MTKWENNALGKAGRFYPILYLMPIPVIIIALVLFSGLFISGSQPLLQLMAAGFGIFFTFYFWKIVEALIITRSTVQKIEYDGNISVETHLVEKLLKSIGPQN